MRVLVTGHRGFIGSHLCRELARHGYQVVGHDKTEGDLTEPGVFARSLDRHQPDRVVHLAAQVGRLFGDDDRIHTLRSNTQMTMLVATACGERDIPVLYSSTSEVYGDQGDTVCYENGACGLPHNWYGLSKRHGEEVLQLFAPHDLRIVRLSMPAGPGAPPGRGRRALDNFLWHALHRQPLTVHRRAERSWCHVSDCVAGIRLVLETGTPGIYNVGRDDRPVSMLELAQMSCDLVNAPRSLIVEIDAPFAQTVVKRLSTAKLRSLGWEPQFELEDILEDVLQWVARFDAEGRMAA